METQIGNLLVDAIIRFAVPHVQASESDLMAKIAASPHPVLLLGESGTGKELAARAIHFNGPRRHRPFLAIDCGTLVPSLIETELFGYVRGAFTGATGSKTGLLSLADEGTIFLDEIGELPLDLQSKLLRALQEREIRPVGGTRKVEIKSRIIAATNRDLQKGVESGAFRKDLYYRLSVLNLRIPPLRERMHDLPELAKFLLRNVDASNGETKILSGAAIAMMKLYPWPGNIRELDNCLKRASVFASDAEIQVCDLPPEMRMDLLTHMPSSETPSFANGKVVPLSEMERNAIVQALHESEGDRRVAAKLLGIGKTTLYRKVKEYGLLHKGKPAIPVAPGRSVRSAEAMPIANGA